MEKQPCRFKENQCLQHQLFNCDESGLYWMLMPNKTIVHSREKEAKEYKKPKDSVKLMACAKATRSIKLLLLFLHKSLNLRCIKNEDKNDLPVHYYAQKSSRMDSSIFKTWCHETSVQRCRKALGEKDLGVRGILLLDNAPSHPDIESLYALYSGGRHLFAP